MDQGGDGAGYKLGIGNSHGVASGIDAAFAEVPAPIACGEVESAVVVEVGGGESGPASLVVEPVGGVAFGGHQARFPWTQVGSISSKESQ